MFCLLQLILIHIFTHALNNVSFLLQILAALRGVRNLSRMKSTCRLCDIVFANRRVLWEHRQIHHRSDQTGAGPPLQPVPWGEQDNNPFDVTRDPAGLPLGTEYGLNEEQILQPHNRTVSRVYEYFNFPLAGVLSDEQIEEQMTYIFNLQTNSYKINLAPGVLLRHRTSGEIRYFFPSLATTVLHPPILIRTRADLDRAIQRIQDARIVDNLNRPDSAWEAKFLTQVKYYVYKLARPLGGLNKITLPPYIVNNVYICTITDCNKSALIDDCMCMFVALAQFEKLQRGAVRDRLRFVKKVARNYCREWCEFAVGQGLLSTTTTTDNFNGVDLKHMHYFENLFKVSVNIYSLCEDGSAYTIYLSDKENVYGGRKMLLNIYETHVNLIYSLDDYCKSHVCHLCERAFPYSYRLRKHLPICGKQTRYVFKGGFKHQFKHLFQRLSALNINIEGNYSQYFSDYFCTWDLESVLEPCNIESKTSNLKFTSTHKPIAAGICSNVPGYTEPHIIVDGDTSVLTRKMLQYMELIQSKMKELLMVKYHSIFYDLEELMEARKIGLADRNVSSQAASDLDRAIDSELRDEFDVEETEVGAGGGEGSNFSNRGYRDLYLNSLQHVHRDLTKYVSQLPCLAYNGSRYDVAILQSELANFFHNKDGGGTLQVVKKGNQFLCLSSTKFRFLDMLQFLGNTMSYAQFLKLIGTAEVKGYFPYDALTSFECLFTKGLPDYPSELWVDSISGSDMLDKEHYIWRQKKVKDVEEPLTGQAKFLQLQQLWQENGWTCLYDLLCHYLTLDIKPFRDAVVKYLDIWTTQEVDVLHSCVSLASLANITMWKQAVQDKIVFPLWPECHKHLYYLTKKNLCGGASIIYSRLQQVNKTKLKKNSSKITKCIEGKDVSALYMYALSGNVPTQSYVWRSIEDDFKPHSSRKLHMMYVWLEHMESVYNCTITSNQTHGFESCLGGYYPDGYSLVPDPDTGKMKTLLFEYNGCYWHNCERGKDCRNFRNVKQDPELLKRRAHTLAKKNDLLALGYDIISTSECDFLDLVAATPSLQSKLSKFKPPFFKRHPGTVSESTILASIRSGELYGFILCSVQCHEDYLHIYDDFPVLFGSMQIEYEHLAQSMKTYMKEKNITYKPRKLLISVNKAEDILLTSDYVQWLLHTSHFHIRVEQIIEFVPNKAFDRYIDNITELRRRALQDPDTAALGAVMKLNGNASYGVCCLRLEMLHDHKYIYGDYAASLAINSPRFNSLTPLDNGYYELSMSKSKIHLNTVNYLANWVTLNGKLHILKYIYDFIHFYIDPTCISYNFMDTDSVYSSYSENSLVEIVKPHLRERFNHELNGRCGAKPYDDVTKFFFPRTCCDRCLFFDNYRPGMMKTEFKCHLSVAITSKTYFLQNFDTSAQKIATKGLQKKRLLNDSTIKDSFLNTVENKVPFYSKNAGMMSVAGKIYSYTLCKKGWEYLYFKRLLCDEGIYTTTLPLVLRPNAPKVLFIQSEGKCLGSDHKFPIKIQGCSFSTIRQAFVYLLADHYGIHDLKEIIMTCTVSTLQNIFDKELKSLVDTGFKDNILKEIISVKYQNCALCRHVLRTNPYTRIINAELDTYLGVGESYSVLRWVDPDLVFKGGKNKLAVGWIFAHEGVGST